MTRVVQIRYECTHPSYISWYNPTATVDDEANKHVEGCILWLTHLRISMLVLEVLKSILQIRKPGFGIRGKLYFGRNKRRLLLAVERLTANVRGFQTTEMAKHSDSDQMRKFWKWCELCQMEKASTRAERVLSIIGDEIVRCGTGLPLRRGRLGWWSGTTRDPIVQATVAMLENESFYSLKRSRHLYHCSNITKCFP